MKKLLLASLLGVASFSSAFASIIGDEFLVEFWLGSPGDAFASQNLTVPGSWNPNNDVPGSGVSDVTLGDGYISIVNDLGGWFGADFNGFYFTDLSQDPGFTSFTLANVSGNAPLLTPSLSFTSNSLLINFTPGGDEALATGSGLLEYTFAFTYGSNASVPDSSVTFGLLALAMGFMVMVRRICLRPVGQ